MKDYNWAIKRLKEFGFTILSEEEFKQKYNVELLGDPVLCLDCGNEKEFTDRVVAILPEQKWTKYLDESLFQSGDFTIEIIGNFPYVLVRLSRCQKCNGYRQIYD